MCLENKYESIKSKSNFFTKKKQSRILTLIPVLNMKENKCKQIKHQRQQITTG